MTGKQKNSRAKGCVGEREAAAFLRTLAWELAAVWHFINEPPVIPRVKEKP